MQDNSLTENQPDERDINPKAGAADHRQRQGGSRTKEREDTYQELWNPFWRAIKIEGSTLLFQRTDVDSRRLVYPTQDPRG